MKLYTGNTFFFEGDEDQQHLVKIEKNDSIYFYEGEKDKKYLVKIQKNL